MLKTLLVLTTLAAAALSKAGPAIASALPPPPTAQITIVNRHQGTNSSITGTIGTLITDPSLLDTVSELHLSSVEGVPAETVTCTPYRNVDGTGEKRGLPFGEGNPGLLSTNTVVVGSIYCSSSQLRCVA